jgi:peptide/nickel transport system ATP-binding protein
LLAALPSDKTWGKPLNVIPGSVPTATKATAGCSFAPRCPSVMEQCRTIDPASATFAAHHSASCHLYPADGVRDA